MIPVNREWCLKTKTYVLGVLIANEVLMFQVLSVDKIRECIYFSIY